ncbi:exodeoxyribonuclease VII small subunit [Planctobacterium marinum]
MATDNTTSQNSFEDSLASLENIVTAMEKGELPLEEALSSFEQGIKLVKHCEEKLKSAEQRVKILTQSDEGNELQDFDIPDTQNP